MLKAELAAIPYRMSQGLSSGASANREVTDYAAQVAVWGRWAAAVVAVVVLAYRPDFWYPDHVEAALLVVALVLVNGLVHARLLTCRPVTWRWMLLLNAMDIILISASIATDPGFDRFIFVAYYPSLAIFLLVFPSVRLGLAWTALTAAAYSLAALIAGGGLDLNAGDERALLGRLAAMFLIALCVMLITRFERARRQAAADREQRLLKERIELSQEMHDTIAQNAYLIDMGIERARNLAGETNQELTGALVAAATLSQSTIWELRRPIDAGRLFEGRELGPALWSHCDTFQSITGVPADMSQSGTEPPLPVETRARLFSIAHNALTNASCHAQPGRVEVRLDFEPERITLSVADDGSGLPDDAGRGRGLTGMKKDAEALGGALLARSVEDGRGTIVSCVVPYAATRGGG